VLFALSIYAKAGFDGVTKLKAVVQLAALLDEAALEVYADQLVRAFVTGKLALEGAGAAASAPSWAAMKQARR